VHVRKWVDQVRAQRGPEVALAIAANKVDLKLSRLVTVEEGEALSKELCIPVLETSGTIVHFVCDQLLNAL